MATPATPEASEIRRRGRRRLIGAVAIALLLIVFVPMILDSEPRLQRSDKELAIPPKESAPPLPAPAPAASTPPAPSQPIESNQLQPKPPPGAAPQPQPPAAKVAVVEPKAVETKPVEPKPAVPKGQEAKAAPKQGFAVQVGAFRDDAKLAQAKGRLDAAKIKYYTEPAGDLTRLRAGPFPTREAADKAAASIRQSTPDAKVVPLP